jgi:hypothetical protein
VALQAPGRSVRHPAPGLFAQPGGAISLGFEEKRRGRGFPRPSVEQLVVRVAYVQVPASTSPPGPMNLNWLPVLPVAVKQYESASSVPASVTACGPVVLIPLS